MTVYAWFRPIVARNRNALACPIAAALLLSTADPAFAAAGNTASDLFSHAQDAGPVDATMPMVATVWLKGHNEALLDRYVADRYDPSSANYHQWLSAEEIAGFGPTTQDVATARASLQALGLSVQKISDDGAAIHVSGTADKMQAAFGTTIRLRQSGGRTFYASTTKPQYTGAHAELVSAVSGLTNVGMQPFATRQLDFATGQPTAGVSAAQAGSNPLSAFTTACFGPDLTAKLSGVAFVVGGASGAVDATFKGPSYLNTTSTTRPACGYDAKQLVAHYGMDAVHARGWTGKGQTIVIVDSFGSPTIAADANIFSKTMGLPALNDRSFQIVYPDGPPDAANSDWALETTLDVEWAHALAPDAKIVLVVAPSDDNAELAYAVHYAAVHRLGNVISNSYGLPEAVADANTAEMFSSVFKRAAAEGISVNVATGDSGDNGVGTPLGAASIPADSPYATGIGGTSIDIPSDRGPVEAAWGINLTQLGQITHPLHFPNIQGFLQGSGGGESVFLEKPRYQRHLPGIGRQLPDVSALGDPQTGAICVQTDPTTGQPQYFVVGGTSLATPMFSAIWALADEAAGESLGQAAPALAAMPSNAFRDVVPIVAKKDDTAGSITFRATTTTAYDPAQLLGLDQTQPDGFIGALVYVGMKPFDGYNDVGFGADSSLKAGIGWDNATGYGVPNGMRFIDEARRLARKSS